VSISENIAPAEADTETVADGLKRDAKKAGERVGLTSDEIIINGGRPLHGRIEVRGAKNLATKAMVAALLGRTPSVLRNVPNISDVHREFGHRIVDAAECPEIENATMLREGARHAIVLVRKSVSQRSQPVGESRIGLFEIRVVASGNQRLMEFAIEFVAARVIPVRQRDRCAAQDQSEPGQIVRNAIGREPQRARFQD